MTRLSTDSRTIQSGDLFVALRGANFDGHKFVEQAAASGAVGALVENDWNGRTAPSFALLAAAQVPVGVGVAVLVATATAAAAEWVSPTPARGCSRGR